MNYVIYARKSTESEDRQILSIDAQERELFELAKKEGLTVTRVFKESMSAKDTGRPVFAEMLNFLRKEGVCGILTWKIDRLARNLVDGGIVIDLLQRGIIGCIRTHDRICLPSDNVLMLSVEFGMANQYVRDLSANVKRGNREKLARGEWPNHAPLGYINDKATKTIAVDEPKRKYVVRAFELYATGTHSYKDISDILFNEGLRTNSGGKVYRGHIQRMLANPFYMGVMERHGKYYPGKHETIISKLLFDTVRQVSIDESRPRQKTLFFPLRSFLLCATCGCRLTASRKKGHDYYYCTNGKQGCDEHKTYMRGEFLYPLVASILDDLQFDEETVEIMYQAARERSSTSTSYAEQTSKTLHASLESLTAKESRLLDSYLAEQIPQALYEEKMRNLANERVTLEKQIGTTRKQSPSPEDALEPIKKVFLEASRARKEFLRGDEQKKHKILERSLWNLSIKDRKIASVQYKKQFEVIAKSPKKGEIATLLRD